MKSKIEIHPLVAVTGGADCRSAVSRIGNPPDSQGASALPNSIRRHGRLAICVTLAFAALTPSPLFACAACYGKSDSPLASGMNWGILTPLGVVLTGIALFFVHIVRREEKGLCQVGTTCWSSEAAQQRGPTIQIVNPKAEVVQTPLAGLTKNRVVPTCRSARPRSSTFLPRFRGSSCEKPVRGNL